MSSFLHPPPSMYWILVTFQYIQTLHTHFNSKNFQFAAIYYKENNGISNIWFLLWSVVTKLLMLMFVTTENWPVTIDQTECCRCHQCHLVTSSVFALCLTRGHCGKLYFGVNHNTVNNNTEVLWFTKYTEVHMKYHFLNNLRFLASDHFQFCVLLAKIIS